MHLAFYVLCAVEKNILVVCTMSPGVEIRIRHCGLSFELVNTNHTNLNAFFADGFNHFTIKMAHIMSVKKNMHLTVKLILSGSFLESCTFKDFYDREDFCEHVNHFIHSTDNLQIDQFTDIGQFYATHVVQYFGEYVTEQMKLVENSTLNEIFDLIVYVCDNDIDGCD